MDARTPASISENPGRSESKRESSASASPTRASPEDGAARTDKKAASRARASSPAGDASGSAIRRSSPAPPGEAAPDSGGDAPRSSAVSSARAAFLCAPSAPASRLRCLERSGEAKRGSRHGPRGLSASLRARAAFAANHSSPSAPRRRRSRSSSKKRPSVEKRGVAPSPNPALACRGTRNSETGTRNSRRCSLSVSQSMAESGRRLGVGLPRASSPKRASSSYPNASPSSSSRKGGTPEPSRRKEGSWRAKTPSALARRRRSKARRDDDEKDTSKKRSAFVEPPSPKAETDASRRGRGADRLVRARASSYAPLPCSLGVTLSARARRETRLRSRAISVARASSRANARSWSDALDDADAPVADLEALDAEDSVARADSDAPETRLAAGSSRAPSRSWRSRRPRRSRRSAGSSGALIERRDETAARVSRSSSRASLDRVVSTRRARVSRRRRSRRSRRSSRSRASLRSRSWRSRWRVCVRDSMRSRRSVKRSSSRSSRTNASRSAPAAGAARGDAEDAAASRLAPRREDDAIAVSRLGARAPRECADRAHFPIQVRCCLAEEREALLEKLKCVEAKNPIFRPTRRRRQNLRNPRGRNPPRRHLMARKFSDP